MSGITTIYPPLIKTVKATIEQMGIVGYPVYGQCFGRTDQKQIEIYPVYAKEHPEQPVRWSLHLVGLAVDFYPVAFSKWPQLERMKRFNTWPGWDRLDIVQVEAGWDKDKPFQGSDRCHVQKTYGLEAEIRRIYYSTPGDHNHKVANVWRFLDLHVKS